MPSGRHWYRLRWDNPVATPPTCWTASSAGSDCRAACRTCGSARSISTGSRSRRWQRRGSRATRAKSIVRRRCAKFFFWPHRSVGGTMYTGKHAHLRPLQPAFIMANSGEAVTYAELEARSNRLAHLFRKLGLKRLDHYAIFMENNGRYLEACAAGERAGLYYTCVNSYLTPGELAYIVNNSCSRVLITSVAKLDVAREALKACPKVELCVVADGPGESERIVGLREATAGLPKTPIADECIGTAMLYSSGTTGRPKGILRALPVQPPTQQLPLFDFLPKLWHYREGMIYLSPAPLYHSAPQAAVNLMIRMGGTVIIMESFDPERCLELIQQWGVTHSQLVPTMFSRMLKLPEQTRTRYDLSSLEIAIHAAAPCPGTVKEDMIKWWGPIIHEYYGATEGLGFTACNSAQWRAPRGTVGKVLLGDLHILDENMKACRSVRPAPSGSRPPRPLNISTIRARPKRPARRTAA